MTRGRASVRRSVYDSTVPDSSWLKIVTVACALSLSGACQRTRTEPEILPVERALPADTSALLARSDHFELLLLDPNPPSSRSEAQTPPRFHDYKENARRELTEAASRAHIISLVQQGVANNHGQAKRCFNPRYAIHATAGDQVVDLLICYECGSVEIYDADKFIAGRFTDDGVAPAVQSAFRAAGLHD